MSDEADDTGSDDTDALDIIYSGLARHYQVAYQTIGLHPSGLVATTAVAAALALTTQQANVVLTYLGDAGLIEQVEDQEEWIAGEQVRAHAEACAHSDPYRDSCNARTIDVITTRLVDYYRLAMNAANHRLMPHRPILETCADIPRSFPLPVFGADRAARDWLGRHWETLRHFWRLASKEYPLMGMQYIDGMAVGRTFLRRDEDVLTMLAEAQAAGQLAIADGDYDVALVCAANTEDLAKLLGDRRALATASATCATVHRERREYAAAARYYSHEQEILAGLPRTPEVAGLALARQLGRSLIESALVRYELGAWWNALIDARRAVRLLMNVRNGDGPDVDLDLARARVELVAASVRGLDITSHGELIRLVVRLNRALPVVEQHGDPAVTQRAYRVAAAVAERLPTSLAGRLPSVLRAHAAAPAVVQSLGAREGLATPALR